MSRRIKISKKKEQTLKKTKRVSLGVKARKKKIASGSAREDKDALLKKTPSGVSPEMSRLERPKNKKLWLKKKKNKPPRGEHKPEKKIKDRPVEVYAPTDLLKLDRDKRFIMWSGVIFFMLLILFFWTMNIRKIFRYTEITGSDDSSLTEWQDIKNEFNKTIEEAKSEVSGLEQKLKQSKEANNNLPMAAGLKEIEKLKEKLEEIK